MTNRPACNARTDVAPNQNSKQPAAIPQVTPIVPFGSANFEDNNSLFALALTPRSVTSRPFASHLLTVLTKVELPPLSTFAETVPASTAPSLFPSTDLVLRCSYTN
jgi:hypothetical protein